MSYNHQPHHPVFSGPAWGVLAECCISMPLHLGRLQQDAANPPRFVQTGYTSHCCGVPAALPKAPQHCAPVKHPLNTRPWVTQGLELQALLMLHKKDWWSRDSENKEYLRVPAPSITGCPGTPLEVRKGGQFPCCRPTSFSTYCWTSDKSEGAMCLLL